MHKQIEEIRNISRRQGCPCFCKNAYSHKAKMAYLYEQIAIIFGAIGITSKENTNILFRGITIEVFSSSNFKISTPWQNDQF